MKNKHTVFTSVNRAYLSRALTLARSVHEHDPDVHFVLLLVEPELSQDFEPEKVFKEFLNEDAFNEILTLKQLNTSDIANFENYSVIEMCTAVKGIASQFLLNREESKIVTYLDPDLYFFTSLEEIRREHQNSDVLLTPHLIHNPTDNSVIHNDEVAGSMKHGIFNLGFVSFKSSTRGKMIASWWADRLAISSSSDYQRGLFTDQKWWDLSLIYFPDIGVLKNDGFNMAPWNLSERILVSLEPPTLMSGDLLVFFHFSKFPGKDFFEKTLNYSKPELLSTVISEYSHKFDQAKQDVKNLVVDVEKYLSSSSLVPREGSFGKTVRNNLFKGMNSLLYKFPTIYSTLAKFPLILPKAKWIYRKFATVSTRDGLAKYDYATIRSEIGEKPLRILITHKGGGGVEEVVKFRSSQIGRAGVNFAILRPIDQKTFRLTVGDKSFILPGVEELKDVLSLSHQIEIHHIFGLEKILDLFEYSKIDAIYLHDRYFISQTPFADSLQYGDLQFEVAGVNTPLNENFAIDPIQWSEINNNFLKQAKKIYSPSPFLTDQFHEAFPDLVIYPVIQDHDFEPYQPKTLPDEHVRQITLIAPTNFHKGAHVLLKVAQFMERETPAITIVVIGDLDFRISSELTRLKNIVLVPQMSRDRLRIKLSEVKNGIGWIPSITAESYSLALSDFLATGHTVVASKLGAIAERLSSLPNHFVYDASAKTEDLARDLFKLASADVQYESYEVLRKTKV